MICSTELELFDLNDNSTVQYLNLLFQISSYYRSIHKYLGLIICIVGSLANAVHFIVLTRPRMRRCSINCLLGLVAMCDILTMVSYIVFTLGFSIFVDTQSQHTGYSLGWIVFLLIHVVGSIGLHTITLYTSVFTAFVRYKALKKVACHLNRSEIALPVFIVITLCVGALCVPTFLVHQIYKVETDQGDFYTISLSELSKGETCFIFKANLWLTGIVFKVIPCILLLTFTIALLSELQYTRHKRRRLVSGNSAANKRAERTADRTTLTLIVLMTIFVLTEFPQGILAILNGLFPNDIHQFVYLNFGELLDLLSLINCNVCFIVYPCMSSVYRATWKSIFGRCLSLAFSRPVKDSTTLLTPFIDEQDVFL